MISLSSGEWQDEWRGLSRGEVFPFSKMPSLQVCVPSIGRLIEQEEL